MGWHFIREDRRLRYDDNMLVAPGYTYSVPGPVAMCTWGLHASERAIDALSYAPGPIVCRVRLGRGAVTDGDKSVSTSREVLWMADASTVLHEFACRVAEQVLLDAGVTDERAWRPIKAKRRWLKGEITDQQLDAARDAARDARAAQGRRFAAMTGLLFAREDQSS